MEKKGKIALFIPTYNESKIIGGTLFKLIDALQPLGRPYEIWVADDGSTDGTATSVRNIIAQLPKAQAEKIRLYEGKTNKGRGEVLHGAFKEADAEVICFMDADLATDLAYLPRLIHEIDEGNDVAAGSRWTQGSIVERAITRTIVSYVYNKMVQLMFDSKMRDHQCGFKSFRRQRLLQLLKEAGTYENRLWAWDTEILVRAQKHGYKISEFPVKWKSGRKSSFKYIRDMTVVMAYLIRLKRRLKKEENSF